MIPSADRRKMHWEKVVGFRAKLAVVVGTALGAGMAPIAPGTAGTVVGLPIVYYTADWALWPRLALWSALFFAGTWAAQVFDNVMGSGDHQRIVIDEVVGMGVTAWTLHNDPAQLAFAFFLFRILDVVKPPPIRQLDLWSKKKAKEHRSYWGGFGVMADDLVAALIGLLVIVVLQRSGYFR